MRLVLLAVIGTLQLGGETSPGGGDFVLVPIDVPAGTVELEVAHADDSTQNILDWGIWSPEGWRGWAGGLEEPAIVGVDASSRAYVPGPITPGEWTIVIGKAKIPQPPARWTVDVTFRDAPTIAPDPRLPWAPVTLAAGARWYAGDFHVHSRQSGDSLAEIGDIVTLARARGLDFVALSDHNTIAQDELLAFAQQGLSDLLLVRSVEVTTYGGHGGAVGLGAYVDHRVGLGGRTAAQIIDDVTAAGAAFIVNHPALDLGDVCIGCAWRHGDTPWEKVAAVEIQTGPWLATIGTFTPLALAFWDERVAAGYRLAAVGGSDDHKAGMNENMNQSPLGSPTTLVFADELSEAGVLAGLRAGRTVVKLRGPEDPFVELTAENEAGERAMIGDELAAGTARVTVHVVGGAGRDVDLVRSGATALTAAVDSDDWTGTFELPVAPAGDRVRAELYEDDLRVVVTSHIWLTYAAPPPAGGGCGCRAGRGRGVSSRGALIIAVALAGFVGVARARRR